MVLGFEVGSGQVSERGAGGTRIPFRPKGRPPASIQAKPNSSPGVHRTHVRTCVLLFSSARSLAAPSSSWVFSVGEMERPDMVYCCCFWFWFSGGCVLVGSLGRCAPVWMRLAALVCVACWLCGGVGVRGEGGCSVRAGIRGTIWGTPRSFKEQKRRVEEDSFCGTPRRRAAVHSEWIDRIDYSKSIHGLGKTRVDRGKSAVEDDNKQKNKQQPDKS